MRRETGSVLLMLGVLCSLWGCEPVKEAGEATISFVRGDLTIEEVEHPIDDVYAATQKAMRDLDLAIVSEEKSSLLSKVVARDERDDKIQIWAERLTSDTTRLKIRIGLTGDQTRSWAIYDQIQENL